MLNKCIIFKETALQKNINLKWNVAKKIYIKADPAAIDRIINNLLDNAIKYTEKTGTIDIGLNCEGDSIKLTVSDTGIGISDEQKKRIFSPYYQLTHKKRNYQGLGMGLHITNNIIKNLNGNITVNGKPEKGTEFTVTLKKYDKQTGDTVKTDFELTKPAKNVISIDDLTPGEHDENKKTVFIVEDNLQMVAGLINELREKHNIDFSTNGKEALKKLEIIQKPDIIISDIMMDIMDGYEFREHLIKIKKYKSIPFIFLTAKSGIDEKLKGLSQGAVDYIRKPFNLVELQEKIKTWIMLIGLNKSGKDMGIIHKQRLEFSIKKYNLTTREKDVLECILDGKTNREMVEKLGIGDSTVRKHQERLKEKMGFSKKTDLVEYLFAHVYK